MVPAIIYAIFLKIAGKVMVPASIYAMLKKWQGRRPDIRNLASDFVFGHWLRGKLKKYRIRPLFKAGNIGNKKYSNFKQRKTYPN